MSLSERVRAGSEAAPWVVDEIKKLEDQMTVTQDALDYLHGLTSSEVAALRFAGALLRGDERRHIICVCPDCLAGRK